METLKMQELLKQLEDLKKETQKEKSAESEKVKREKVGSSPHDLRTAFIDKIPQGIKERKSFMLNVVKFDVTQSNVDGLIDWLRRNNREERADEVEANKNRFFDISILCDDGSTEIFNSGILAYDKKNTLGKLVVKSGDGFEYYISRMTWDADNKELIFS